MLVSGCEEKAFFSPLPLSNKMNETSSERSLFSYMNEWVVYELSLSIPVSYLAFLVSLNEYVYEFNLP